MVDQPGAIGMYVPLEITFDSVTPMWIVIHKTAGFSTAQDCASYFQSMPGGLDSPSSHYIVGRDGTIIQCVSESRGAGANCCLETGHASFLPSGVNLNNYTISIEHIDPATDNSTPCTPEQIAASIALIHGISARHNIPLRAGDATGGIIRHADIAPINRARCPGNYPLSDVLTSLQQYTEDLTMIQIGQGMGAFFTDSGNNRWHCKNTNVDLIGTNLDFWRKYEGLGGLPLTNEIYLSQLPGTAIVVCERWVQIFDPGKKNDNPPGAGDVYLMHITSGYAQQYLAQSLLKALQDQYAALKQQLADAQKLATDAQSQLAAYKAANPPASDLQTQLANYKKAIGVVLSTLQPLQ